MRRPLSSPGDPSGFAGVLTGCVVWGRLSFGNSTFVSLPCASLSTVPMNSQGLAFGEDRGGFVPSRGECESDGNLPF